MGARRGRGGGEGQGGGGGGGGIGVCEFKLLRGRGGLPSESIIKPSLN